MKKEGDGSKVAGFGRANLTGKDKQNAFDWALRLVREWAKDPMQPPTRGTYIIGVQMTSVYGAMLIAAMLIGLLCVHVYGEAKRRENNDSTR